MRRASELREQPALLRSRWQHHIGIGQAFANMTVKAVMHQMRLRFRWSVPANYELDLGWGTGPTPVDGLPIHLKALSSVERAQADTSKRTA